MLEKIGVAQWILPLDDCMLHCLCHSADRSFINEISQTLVFAHLPQTGQHEKSGTLILGRIIMTGEQNPWPSVDSFTGVKDSQHFLGVVVHTFVVVVTSVDPDVVTTYIQKWNEE